MTLARVWLAAAAVAVGAVSGKFLFPLGACVAGVAVWLVALRRRSALRLTGAVLAVGLLAGLSTSLRSTPHSAIATLARSVPRCVLTARVVERVGPGALLTVSHARCDGFAPASSLGAVMTDEIPGEPGAVVEAAGFIVPLRDGPLDVMAARAGALARLELEDVRVLRAPTGAFAVAASFRRALGDAVGDLDEGRAGLLRGLTIGDTSGLDPETMELIRRAGLTHLVAVSGSNVAIVVGALWLLLRGASLKLRLAASFVGIAWLVLVVGPEPSVLRAAAMGGIALAALSSGRRAQPLHALGLAIIVVLALRPGLVHSVGLQLSAAATAGIVLWARSIADAFAFLPRIVVLPLATTVAAQAAVLPVIVATFGEMSLTGVLANVLVSVVVPPATLLGMAAALVELALPGFGGAPARLAEPMAGWIITVATALGGPQWAAVALPEWSGALAAIPVVIAAVLAVRQMMTVRLPHVCADDPDTPTTRR